MDILSTLYPWIKSLHIIAVISWMAGMLYLPRLFVFHVETYPSHCNLDESIVRWGRLFVIRIIKPAMTITWICGALMLMTPGIIDWTAGWIWVKLASVTAMSGFHGFLSKQRKLLAAGERPYTGRQYRMLNEVPTVLMIIIVVMVIARPF